MIKITVLINIGRRVPRSWFRAGVNKVQSILSFQEHLWVIIKQSLNLAKKKANAAAQEMDNKPKLKFVLTTDKEIEDLNYEIEWIKIIIQGTPEQEQEEYNEAMRMYEPFGKIFKKDMPTDDRLKQHFKTKILSNEKIQEAYKKGYGVLSNNNLSNKLLEMGILTHIEIIKDYDSRLI